MFDTLIHMLHVYYNAYLKVINVNSAYKWCIKNGVHILIYLVDVSVYMCI